MQPDMHVSLNTLAKIILARLEVDISALLDVKFWKFVQSDMAEGLHEDTAEMMIELPWKNTSKFLLRHDITLLLIKSILQHKSSDSDVAVDYLNHICSSLLSTKDPLRFYNQTFTYMNQKELPPLFPCLTNFAEVQLDNGSWCPNQRSRLVLLARFAIANHSARTFIIEKKVVSLIFFLFFFIISFFFFFFFSYLFLFFFFSLCTFFLVLYIIIPFFCFYLFRWVVLTSRVGTTTRIRERPKGALAFFAKFGKRASAHTPPS